MSRQWPGRAPTTPDQESHRDRGVVYGVARVDEIASRSHPDRIEIASSRL